MAKKKKKELDDTPEVDDTPVYVFDEEIHPAGEPARQVQLTAEDLDPRNDAKLKVLFGLIDDPEMEPYFQMPSLRGLKNYVESVEVSLQADFVNYKKRGRI